VGIRKKHAIAGAVAALWLGLIGIGVAVAVRESTTAGAASDAPPTWPTRSRIPRGRPGASRVVMFVHPQCPCTRASLHELQAVVAAVGDRIDVAIVFVRPDDAPADWLDTDRWAQAKAIPGAAVLTDGGAELARFGAQTSGHVVMYDPSGRLVFSGGITGSRGHEGDNVGRDEVIELAKTAVVATATKHPVYGCGLGARR
jgi:hypothetical protein